MVDLIAMVAYYHLLGGCSGDAGLSAVAQARWLSGLARQELPASVAHQRITLGRDLLRRLGVLPAG